MKILKWGCLMYIGLSVISMFTFGLSEMLGSGVTGLILILSLSLFIIISFNKSPEPIKQFFSSIMTQYFPRKGCVPKLLKDSEQLTESDFFEDTMSLRTTLRKLGSSQGAGQLSKLGNKYENLKWILEKRLNAGELTLQRYLESAKQVYLSALYNLNEMSIALKSTSAIDLDYIEKRIMELKTSLNPSHTQKAEISSLEERRRIFYQHHERVSRLLSENESAMTVLDKTAAAFAETETGKGGASMDISEAMRELEMLAKRAHRYKR